RRDIDADECMSTELSLILCTLGRTTPLERLLVSLQAQLDSGFELVIVDQNPPGYLADFVARAGAALRVQYLRSVPGLSRARNVGIRASRGELLAFPDDDCWYEPDTVASIRRRFTQYPEFAIVTGRTTDARGRDSNGKFSGQSAAITRQNVWYCGTSNSVFVRRALALKLGGFDETLGVGAGTPFGAGEETDFLLRALSSGERGFFFHDLLVHHDQADVRINQDTLRRAASYARGFGRVLRLHRYSRAYLAMRLVRNCAAAMVALLGINLPFARLKLVWARYTLAGYRSHVAGARGRV
ncbi:MAG TPA: glycosyltransferase, partial [Steroidobacteraceae bacterium]